MKNKLSQEKLEKQINGLRKTSFAFKIASFTSLVAVFASMIFNIVISEKHNEAQEEFINKTPYVEFAENDYNQKVADLENKIYNKEIPISEYDKELDKIKKITKEEYFDKHASVEDKEKYNSLIEAEDKVRAPAIGMLFGTFCATGVLGGAMLATQWTQEAKEKKLKKQREIENPRGGFYCPPDIEL